ncbi:MAG: FAD-binding oxidoreductase [Bdellovibrionales bacterium]|nr:FAD-binding oxidoreductase [Bdellovibrionales bacterium]
MTFSVSERELRARLEKQWADILVTDPGELEAYGRDWTRFVAPRPLAAAFPRTAEQLAALLKFCNENNVRVVPSGGRTGLAGGAVAPNGELVVSVARLTQINTVNLTAQTVRVGAGVVNQTVQEHCAHHQLFWPVELGSKGSCTVGGNLATNAGGVRVIRYGHARHWVQSVQVALMSGELLEFNGELEKNNTGYDFRHLLVGSEGTLGMITAATLKLAPLPAERDVLLLAVADMEKVLDLLRSARQHKFPLLAFECLTDACYESVLRHRKINAPLAQRAPFYVLIDIEQGSHSTGLDAWLQELYDRKWVVDGTLSQSASDARKLWEVRENITESLAARGLVYKNDLALPVAALDSFMRALLAEAPRWYGSCELFFFGHIGDGNIHVNVLKPAEMADADFLRINEAANDPLFALVRRHGGSIAAEHGIGLLKKRFLSYSRTESEIALLRGVKKVFDPKGLLNPGKIFDV